MDCQETAFVHIKHQMMVHETLIIPSFGIEILEYRSV